MFYLLLGRIRPHRVENFCVENFLLGTVLWVVFILENNNAIGFHWYDFI